MKQRTLFAVLLCLSLALSGIAFAKGGGNVVTCTNSIYSKHLQMAGGDCNKCLTCHTKTSKDDKSGIAYAPPVLTGRYANMGGPNHSCQDCHDGVKAPLLPATSCLSQGSSCASCHY